MSYISETHFSSNHLSIVRYQGEPADSALQSRELLSRIGEAVNQRFSITVKIAGFKPKVYDATLSSLWSLLAFAKDIASQNPEDPELQALFQKVKEAIQDFSPLEKLAVETQLLICDRLSAKDLIALSATSKKERALVEDVILKRAQKYGYQGSDIKHAKLIIFLYESDETYKGLTPEQKTELQKQLKTLGETTNLALEEVYWKGSAHRAKLILYMTRPNEAWDLVFWAWKSAMNIPINQIKHSLVSRNSWVFELTNPSLNISNLKVLRIAAEAGLDNTTPPFEYLKPHLGESFGLTPQKSPELLHEIVRLVILGSKNDDQIKTLLAPCLSLVLKGKISRKPEVVSFLLKALLEAGASPKELAPIFAKFLEVFLTQIKS